MVDRQVGSDPACPGTEVAIGAKPVPGAVNSPKSLHGQILRSAPVAYDADDPGIDIALKLTYQGLERIDLAMREPLEQIHELLYRVLRDTNTQVTSFSVSARPVVPDDGTQGNRAILSFEDDYKDQIHDETARQARSAFGIGLSIALLSSDSNPRRPRQSRGLLVFANVSWPVAKLEKHVTVTHAMRRFESCPASQI